MSYSVDKLTTVSDCNSLLVDAAKDKRDLELKKANSEKSREDKDELSVELVTDLAAAEADFQNNKTQFENALAGPSKRKYELALRKAEVKLLTLKKKEEDNGPKAIVKLEADIARLKKEIEELTVYMTELETRKAAI